MINALDILNVKTDNCKRTTLPTIVLCVSFLIAPLALLVPFMFMKLGIYRYDKKSYENITYLKNTALIYVFASALLLFIGGIALHLLAKAWLMNRLLKNTEFISVNSKKHSKSDIQFAEKAFKFMLKKNESELIVKQLSKQKEDDIERYGC